MLIEKLKVRGKQSVCYRLSDSGSPRVTEKRLKAHVANNPILEFKFKIEKIKTETKKPKQKNH